MGPRSFASVRHLSGCSRRPQTAISDVLRKGDGIQTCVAYRVCMAYAYRRPSLWRETVPVAQGQRMRGVPEQREDTRKPEETQTSSPVGPRSCRVQKVPVHGLRFRASTAQTAGVTTSPHARDAGRTGCEARRTATSEKRHGMNVRRSRSNRESRRGRAKAVGERTIGICVCPRIRRSVRAKFPARAEVDSVNEDAPSTQVMFKRRFQADRGIAAVK